MRDEESPEGAAFAALLRKHRAEKSLKQDDVIHNTSPSRSTYLRWESGKVESPDLRQVREVCLYLGINPPVAAVALGLCTNEELGLPPAEPEFPPIIYEIGRILANPSTCKASRDALTLALEAALNLWRMAVAMPEPAEPNGNSLTRRKQKAR